MTFFVDEGGPLAFEDALSSCFKARMIADERLCQQVWGALTNVEWIHENGKSVLYTFRSAAEAISSILGDGDYTDWYCCGPTAVVSDEIRAAMKAEGWVPVIQALQ